MVAFTRLLPLDKPNIGILRGEYKSQIAVFYHESDLGHCSATITGASARACRALETYPNQPIPNPKVLYFAPVNRDSTPVVSDMTSAQRHVFQKNNP